MRRSEPDRWAGCQRKPVEERRRGQDWGVRGHAIMYLRSTRAFESRHLVKSGRDNVSVQTIKCRRLQDCYLEREVHALEGAMLSHFYEIEPYHAQEVVKPSRTLNERQLAIIVVSLQSSNYRYLHSRPSFSHELLARSSFRQCTRPKRRTQLLRYCLGLSEPYSTQYNLVDIRSYSTVTDLAKFLGKSTLRPSPTASQ